MRKLGRTLCISALVFCLGVSTAVAADDSPAAALADACTSCHGINGHSHGYIPSLVMLSRKQFIQALEDYRAQKRSATIMNRIARNYTPAEIELLADYFTSGLNR
jgi:cytochrome subunit of sulfide dehydrogenase